MNYDAIISNLIILLAKESCSYLNEKEFKNFICKETGLTSEEYDRITEGSLTDEELKRKEK